MSVVTLLSPAKINLALRVHGKRSDGYHEITSLMQPVSLFDTVKIEAAEGSGVALSTQGVKVPDDESNLAYKAALLYLKEAGTQKKVSISLNKAVPTMSGLGGGSSNAAAVLVGLNRLTGALSENELIELSPQLGADVAFFIRCRAAVVTGTGEKVNILSGFPLFYYVVAYPGFGVSTDEVYKKWDSLKGGCSDKRPEFEKLHEKFLDPGAELPVFNDLEEPSLSVCPALKKYKKMLRSLDAKPFMLSGSGSCMFAAFRENAPARDLYRQLSLLKDTELFLLKGISGWQEI